MFETPRKLSVGNQTVSKTELSVLDKNYSHGQAISSISSILASCSNILEVLTLNLFKSARCRGKQSGLSSSLACMEGHSESALLPKTLAQHLSLRHLSSLNLVKLGRETNIKLSFNFKRKRSGEFRPYCIL